MRHPIREKIWVELNKLYKETPLQFNGQDEYFWLFGESNINNMFRVFKLFQKHHNGFYMFHTQMYNVKEGSWKEHTEISVQTERFDDDKDEYWKDPEVIRPNSLQGLRIRLHQAYKVTENIFESFYLVSNEIYDSTLDTVAWFEDKSEDKQQHEHVMGYNTLKFFHAFEVFKEDLNNQPPILKELYPKDINVIKSIN